MWFWVFMLAVILLLPGSMLGFGSYFYKKAPDRIDSVFGYRTSMSMKNRDTWQFAHRTCGRLWRILGGLLLAGSVIAMLFLFGSGIQTIAIAAIFILAVQLLFLLGSIFPVERALKKNFDQQGKRRQ